MNKVNHTNRTYQSDHVVGNFNQPMSSEISALKGSIREIAARYPKRYDRARRLYVQDRAIAFEGNRELEYKIKSEIQEYFDIPYGDVMFAGSAQIGFSAHKDTIFAHGRSDLDVACVNNLLFQKAWIDLIEASHAFDDKSSFGSMKSTEIDAFREGILKRGMIKVEYMPGSQLANRWRFFESSLTRKYAPHFGSINVAIYMNEYAFCWKQDSALGKIVG